MIPFEVEKILLIRRSMWIVFYLFDFLIIQFSMKKNYFDKTETFSSKLMKMIFLFGLANYFAHNEFLILLRQTILNKHMRYSWYSCCK